MTSAMTMKMTKTHKDKYKLLKRPITCYIFERAQGYQIWHSQWQPESPDSPVSPESLNSPESPYSPEPPESICRFARITSINRFACFTRFTKITRFTRMTRFGTAKKGQAYFRSTRICLQNVCLWSLCGPFVVPLWSLCGAFVVPLWCLCGAFVVPLWCFCGAFVVLLWCLCGPTCRKQYSRSQKERGWVKSLTLMSPVMIANSVWLLPLPLHKYLE